VLAGGHAERGREAEEEHSGACTPAMAAVADSGSWPLAGTSSAAGVGVVRGGGCGLAAIGTVAFTLLDGHLPGWAFSQEQDGTYRKTFSAARYLIAEAGTAG
jgi:hypothetical protein